MNNARYPREADFARTKFYASAGITDYFMKHNVRFFMTACVTRYRKPLVLLQLFKVTTKVGAF